MLARPALPLGTVRAAPLVAAARATDLDVVAVAHLHRTTLFGRTDGGLRVASEHAAPTDEQRHHLPHDAGSLHARTVARGRDRGQQKRMASSLRSLRPA